MLCFLHLHLTVRGYKKLAGLSTNFYALNEPLHYHKNNRVALICQFLVGAVSGCLSCQCSKLFVILANCLALLILGYSIF